MKKITNEITTTGLVICPVCNRPPSWLAGGRLHSSPMVRITMSNLDALVHNCCLHLLYTDINGQISIHRRRKLILAFLPACGKFLSGAAHLAHMLFKHGIKDGLAKLNTAQVQSKDAAGWFEKGEINNEYRTRRSKANRP